MKEDRHFSDQEAEAILREAARIDGIAQSSQSRQHLIAAAAELGISEQAVMEAERRVAEQHQLDLDKAEFIKHRNGKLMESIWSFVGTSALLLGINYMTSGFRFNFPHMWALWVIGIWGLCLGSEVVQTLFGNQARQEAAFEKWRKRRNRKRNKGNVSDVEAPSEDFLIDHPNLRVVRKSSVGATEAQGVDDPLTTRGLD